MGLQYINKLLHYIENSFPIKPFPKRKPGKVLIANCWHWSSELVHKDSKTLHDWPVLAGKTNSARCTTHTWSTWYTSYWAEADKHATQTNSRSYTQCQEGTLLSTIWRVRNMVTTRFCVFWNADWQFLNRNRSIPCKTIYASGTNNPALTNSHNFLSKESTRYFLTVLGESDAYIEHTTNTSGR